MHVSYFAFLFISSFRSYDAVDIDNELLLTDLSCADLSKVKRSFLGAASARKLHLSDMLFFPIEHLEYWFLFVVDIKDRMLVFLDSLHEKGDPYFEDIECLLLIDFFILSIIYRQSRILMNALQLILLLLRNFDSEIFVMKCMELWSPRVVLPNEFSSDDIDNIRMLYAYQILPSNE
uniref:Ubiquitin-like protease family profile domain-containing protein n=1 Tax=Oryza meridionalis TaxID=40149 RepID=A0A0E0D401_9ORYZ